MIPTGDSGLYVHAGWLLLLLAAASGRVRILRAWLLASSFVFLAAAFVAGNAIGMAWPGAVAFICALQLGGAILRGARTRFTPEEQAMLERLPRLGKAEARHLIDQGLWLDARKGDAIAMAGEPVSHLYFLASGAALVSTGGTIIGEVPPGSFIGEVTVLSGAPATGTVEIAAPSRLWCMPADALRAYADQHDDVRRALETAFREALTAKLVASNARLAEAG